MKNVIAVLMMFAAGPAAFGLPPLTQFAVVPSPPDSSFEETMQGYQFFLGGKFDGPVSMITSYDAFLRRWSFVTVSDLYKNTAICDDAGRIVSSTSEVLSGELAERMGLDRRILKVKGGNLVISTMRNGKKTGDVSLALDRPILDVDTMPVLLSEFLRNSPESFNSDIVLKSRGWRINVDFRYFTPNSPEITVESARLPDAYKRILSGYRTGYHCYRMQAAGLLGIFDSTKYYFLFADDGPRRFIGFWGGQGETAEGMVFRTMEDGGALP